MDIPASNLQTIPDYAFYVRTLETFARKVGFAASPTAPHLINGYKPFSSPRHRALRETVVRTSDEQWTMPRPQLEARLTTFLERKFEASGTK